MELPTNEIRTSIKKGRLEEAIQSSIALLDNKTRTRQEKNLYNKLIDLSGRFNTLKEQIAGGNISTSEANRERNNIRKSLIGYVDELDALLKPKPIVSASKNKGITSPTKTTQLLKGIGTVAALALLIFTGYYFLNNKTNYSPQQTCTFLPTDSTNLKIILLPFNPAIELKNRKNDYRTQLIEKLQATQEAEQLSLKLGVCDSVDFPNNFEEAENIGERFGADLVIWGDYKSGKADQLSIGYVLVKDWYIDQAKKQGEAGMQSVTTPKHLRGVYLQNDLDYVIYWIEGMAAYKVFNYAKALERFDKVLAYSEADNYSQETYALLGIIYTKLGEYTQGLAFHEQALQLYLEGDQYNPEDLAAYFNNIAISYHFLKNYSKAYDFFEKTLEIVEKQDNPANLAVLYNNVGVCLNDQYQDHDKAIEYLEKADSIYKNDQRIELNTREDGLATLYNNKASVYHSMRKYEDAIRNLNRTEQIFLKKLPENHPNIALLYNNKATIFGQLGAFNDAKNYYLKAIQIQEEILPPAHPSLLNSYYNLALTYLEQGDWKNALDYFLKQVNALEQKKVTKVDTTFVSAYENIAQIYGQQGNQIEAKGYYDKALKLQNSVGGSHSKKQSASLLSNKAFSFAEQLQYDSAASNYLAALTLLKDVAGIKDADYQKTAKNLGLLYNTQALKFGQNKQFDQAIETYDLGLDLLIPLFGVNDEAVITVQKNKSISYNNQAYTLAEDKQYSAAIDFYHKALDVLQFVSGPTNEEVIRIQKSLAATYNNQAFSFGEKEENEQAIAAYKAAEEILKKVEEGNSIDLAGVYRNLGILYWNTNIDKPEARRYIQLAVAIYQSHLPTTRTNYLDTQEQLDQMKE